MGRRPILVTGVPRSGTTWVARQLALSPGSSMTGREPMNFRDGQYALGRTLTGWTRLHDITRRQRTSLRLAYAGLNPFVFGRYGVRQWAAPLPWTRVVVKDPFALLSLNSIVEATGALPVVSYRHPGAVLTSIRRMKWTIDPAEVEQLESMFPADWPDGATDELSLFARMWTVRYRIALDELDSLDTGIVVSHEVLAAGGEPALNTLRAACGLDSVPETPTGPADRAGEVDEQRLHNLDRDPKQVASAWRADFDDDEQRTLDELTGDVLDELESRALRFDDTDQTSADGG